eukprot:TRINITY_DN27014_c0_g1_i1.p3 TRINITY_DN27014_c0_g1~~TRINITY_DN27014_c0_g1_i1.p3  ORF type:complete len:121 (-),score=27.31 TRINITY_DN27014_c0_g1_i1:23-385(-)
MNCGNYTNKVIKVEGFSEQFDDNDYNCFYTYCWNPEIANDTILKELYQCSASYLRVVGDSEFSVGFEGNSGKLKLSLGIFIVFLLCLLYTSDAADEEDSVDIGGRRIIKKKKYYVLVQVN